MNRPSLTLGQWLPELALGKAASLVPGSLCLDSRQVKQGDIFIALVGTRADGRQFIANAVEQGAAAVFVEADKEWQGVHWIGEVPVIALEQLTARLSELAGRYYAHPSRELRLVGITGTNGKTTCSLLLAQLLAGVSGQGCSAVIGTLGYGLVDKHSLTPIAQQISLLTTTGLTTPDPVALQRILRQLRTGGASSAAIEVSSHSLQQKRVAGLAFDTAIFTNLTQDHLDYHGDLASYGKAKAELLFMPGLKHALFNMDDAWVKALAAKTPAGVSAIGFSLQEPADVYLRDIHLHASGASAWLVSPWGEAEFHSPLLGLFNLSNLVAVVSAACIQGAPLEQVLALVPHLVAAPGRMQPVVVDADVQEIQVLVDYAHTPDALENTLKAIREHQADRIWTVFGCGGDRDKTKRPLMGRIAEKLSDYVIVTNDNPRSEDPARIAADIVRGLNNPNGCLVLADRAQAIDFAVQQAKPGDLVLIAGKGHEDYQIFADQTLPFSDSQQARLALQRRIAKRDQVYAGGQP
ncbi:UDP-N-acetylmuramoyl-L-alanyl-D-glutamate--2,6-diaminopimelate ligase [Cellvibrio japonicus]|uniref:UDP-N-acetylmuramoyl-L-alanyl-D-glutamate--2,6-diaminopimelate ligase n=1 Tax=Cellvibrio japonicus (strain Ueda107) TaxID=498211 RepID=B3PCM5_CELJU|nr:UDP-N-acetylmuramoyl-L-alanyl-D-glutamate--2,6-diaminopimelate ligase [Cellvibrio japonicus]ACE84601.1 UDP-N-acetylmuramoylalanyl-D-glutamate--2,6-diaminopimelate ligase [Cellvibrio japonicus Ueda107]QEI13249.1 UDP-N-acetylmuramoyl-L-alanyl-D-glutamate--2,6-diaminopimelate ligase [Cellvibrio japonicus]QEI16823.1 UDP-N-acetylmuramoyl-L-alanyl-D-glutamate--2,6-diaminopimelate ligase [Cellvibrio japonicus]QEI20401.1 UDP-N-acetylmuramoyl-L-alanyl-D-glutamate--2,6-diaminopimelate ligase [Cellvibr